MTKRLTRIAPLQLGVVFAAFYALFSLIIVPFVMIFVLIAPAIPNGQHATVPLPFGAGVAGMMMVIILPIFYGVFGFIFGLIAAVIYNLVAKMTGGVEITTIEVPSIVATSFQ